MGIGKLSQLTMQYHTTIQLRNIKEHKSNEKVKKIPAVVTSFMCVQLGFQTIIKVTHSKTK